MIIDCIADLHGHYPKMEGGDLLIVCGDLTARDKSIEYQTFKAWLLGQNYKKKIVIAGNHDNYIQNKVCETMWIMSGLEYLSDSGTEFEGLKIWGSPWSKTFPGMNPKCKAFTVDTEEELAERWALIPDDTDILITHSPMRHMLDANIDGYACGSYSLRDHIDRVKPRLHIFGHIHEQGGRELMYKHQGPNTWCVNCSHVNERYQPVNKPIRIVL